MNFDSNPSPAIIIAWQSRPSPFLRAAPFTPTFHSFGPTVAYVPYYGISTGWPEPGFTAHFRTGRRICIRRGDEVLYDASLCGTLVSNAGFASTEELDRYDDYTLGVRLGDDIGEGVLTELWIEDWKLVIQDGGAGEI